MNRQNSIATLDTRNSRRRHLMQAYGLVAALMPLGSIVLAAPSAHAEVSRAAIVYELTVGGQTSTLLEGQSVVYGMQKVDAEDVTYPSDAGTLTVTAANGNYHFDVAMSIPATNFVGTFTVTDLTSGFSGGGVLELVFAGDVPTSKLLNHRYSGSLLGEALFAGVTVAKTVPNNTLYTYN